MNIRTSTMRLLIYGRGYLNTKENSYINKCSTFVVGEVDTCRKNFRDILIQELNFDTLHDIHLPAWLPQSEANSNMQLYLSERSRFRCNGIVLFRIFSVEPFEPYFCIPKVLLGYDEDFCNFGEGVILRDRGISGFIELVAVVLNFFAGCFEFD